MYKNKEINFSKYKNSNKFDLPKDEFIKEKVISINKNKDTIKKQQMINILSAHDYNKVTNSLTKKNLWSDSVNLVGFNKSYDKLSGVNIGIFNSETAKVDMIKTDIDDFIDMYTKVTSKQMDLHPDKVKDYKKTFVDLLKYISKNRLKD